MSTATHPVDELLPAPKLFTLGLQHVLVMYAGAIAVPLIIGRALKLDPADVAFLISADLFTCGIVTLIERHPVGSQAFLPMTAAPFLVIVAPDESERPGRPRAFLTTGTQGINLCRGTWHGVLTPLAAPGLFAVVDRIGEGANLEEYRYDVPWRVVRDDPA